MHSEIHASEHAKAKANREARSFAIFFCIFRTISSIVRNICVGADDPYQVVLLRQTYRIRKAELAPLKVAIDSSLCKDIACARSTRDHLFRVFPRLALLLNLVGQELDPAVRELQHLLLRLLARLRLGLDVGRQLRQVRLDEPEAPLRGARERLKKSAHRSPCAREP